MLRGEKNQIFDVTIPMVEFYIQFNTFIYALISFVFDYWFLSSATGGHCGYISGKDITQVVPQDDNYCLILIDWKYVIGKLIERFSEFIFCYILDSERCGECIFNWTYLDILV